MAVDSAAQVAAISRFLAYEGYGPDFISPGLTPYFHYTGYDAFVSIATKKDLWLTDAGFSNDADELEHGRKFIEKMVKAQAEGGISPELRSLANDIAALNAASALSKETPESVYVCCFCESGDLLSQWRGYAANGGGVAIEVDQQPFGYLAGVDNPLGVMRFWKVFYQDEVKQRRVQAVLDFWAKQPDAPNVRAESAAATLRFFVPTFKNPSFEAEAEWRLIFTPGPTCGVRPKFRVARGLLMPYLELAEVAKEVAKQAPGLAPLIENGAWLVIKNVCVGPGPYKDVNKLSAERLLRDYGFPTAGATPSSIPYRG